MRKRDYSRTTAKERQGVSADALAALDRGTYGQLTNRKPQYTKSNDQSKVVKRVPALEGMSRSTSFKSRPNRTTEKRLDRNEKKEKTSARSTSKITQNSVNINDLVATPASFLPTNMNSKPVSNVDIKMPELKKPEETKKAVKPSSRYRNENIRKEIENPKESERDKTYDKDFEDFFEWRYNKADVMPDFDEATGNNVEHWRKVKQDIMAKNKMSEKEFDARFDEYAKERWQKEADKEVEGAVELSKKSPVLGTMLQAAYTPQTWLEGLATGVEGVASGIGKLTGKNPLEKYMPTSDDDVQFTGTRVKEGAKQEVRDNHIKTGAGKTAYELATGLGDLAMSTAIPGGAAWLGAGNAAKSQMNALERGIDPEKAAMAGTLTGATTAAMNKVGLDAVLDSKGKTLLSTIAKAANREGLENVAEDVADIGIDKLFGGDKSELDTLHQYYLENGGDEDAWGQVLKDKFGDLATSYISGAGMGGVFSGVNNIPQLEAMAASKLADNQFKKNDVVKGILNGDITEITPNDVNNLGANEVPVGEITEPDVNMPELDNPNEIGYNDPMIRDESFQPDYRGVEVEYSDKYPEPENIIHTLTGEKLSPEYAAAIRKLESGEMITSEEYNAIPEIIQAKQRAGTGSTADIKTPEREALREELFQKINNYGSAKEVYNPQKGKNEIQYVGPVARNRRADIIIGLPSSGKSSAVVDPISQKYSSKLLDSDEVKKIIPEFDGGWGAGLVHDESKEILAKAKSAAFANGENVVLPVVGANPKKIKAEIELLKDTYGYEVHLHLNDLDSTKAAARNLRRFASQGRFLDLDTTSFDYGDKPRDTYEILKKEGVADGYNKVSNDVRFGEPPVQIEGTEVIPFDWRNNGQGGRVGVENSTSRSGEIPSGEEQSLNSNSEIIGQNEQPNEVAFSSPEEDLIGDIEPEANTRAYSDTDMAEINDYIARRDQIREELNKNANPTDLVAMTRFNELRQEGKALDAEMQEKYPELFTENGKFTGIPENVGEITQGDVIPSEPEMPEAPQNQGIEEPTPEIPSQDVNSDGSVPPEVPPTNEGDSISRVASHSGINAGIISQDMLDNDPVIQNMAKYSKHSNETTFNSAMEDVRANGDKLLDNYITDQKQIDSDQDVDTAFILLQNLNEQIKGGNDVTSQRNLLFDRLIKAGTKYGQTIQAFKKWNETADGAIVNGQAILKDRVDAEKTRNKKVTDTNNKVAESLAKIREKTNSTIDAALRKQGNDGTIKSNRTPKTREQIKSEVQNSIKKELGSVSEKFTDKDFEFLTDLVEKKTPTTIIADEIEHKLNHGEWYKIDEEVKEPKQYNAKLKSALDSLVAQPTGEREAPTFEQIKTEVRNTLDEEMASVGEFTDDDVNYLSNLIVNKATKEELADALNTKMLTGRFGVSPETQKKVNLLFDEASKYDPNSKQAFEAKSAAYKLIADEVADGATALEKFDSWRYLAMLGNPKTMIRNWVGNKMFGAITGASNSLSAALEAGTDAAVKGGKKLANKFGGKNYDTSTGIQRTKAILNPTKDGSLIEACKADGDNSRYSQISGTKYEKGVRDAIKNQKSVFDSKLVQLYEKAVDRGISDYSAVKNKYGTSLAGYLKANGLDESVFKADETFKKLRETSKRRVLTDAERTKMDDLKDQHDALEKARDFALKQAEYATFHEENEVAKILADTSRKARGSSSAVARGLGYALEGVVPFKKTPANILRSAEEYSPLGALNSLYKTGKLIFENTGSRKGNLADTYKTKGGKEVTKTLVSDVLDSWSKTITGSGLAMLGYILHDKGVLNSSTNDEKYQDQLEGKQNYSITVNGHTVTLDWAAPAVMPLLMGAEISKIAQKNQLLNKDVIENFDEIMGTVNAFLDPMVETSMLQGVKDTLENAANEVRYNDNSASKLGGVGGAMLTGAATNYLTQAYPTAMGQLARTVDPLRRATDTTTGGADNASLSSIEKTGRKLLNKVPFGSMLNEPYRDAYGRTQDNSPTKNPLGAFLYQSLSPAYISKIEQTDADKSARQTYMATGEDGKPIMDSKVFPAWKGKVTVDGHKFDPKEMSAYREKSGNANYEIRDALSHEDWFNNLEGAQQTEILKKVNTLIDKVGKEAAGYPQSGKDIDAYNNGDIPNVLNYFHKNSFNSGISDAGLSSGSAEAKAIKEAVEKGDDARANQLLNQAKKDQAPAQELDMSTDHYQKISKAAGSNMNRVKNDIPKLRELGLKESADYVYVNALKENSSLTPSDFARKYNEIDVDKGNKLTQDEMIKYFNKNKVSASVAQSLWKTYQDGSWKKVPYVKEDGTWGAK